MKMTRKTAKNLHLIAQILDSIVAIIPVAILIAMVVMGTYSLSIALESRSYSAEIGQSRIDSVSYHPDERQEYENNVYLRETSQRTKLYDANPYTQWFFYELDSGISRFCVIIAWYFIPGIVAVFKFFKWLYTPNKV